MNFRLSVLLALVLGFGLTLTATAEAQASDTKLSVSNLPTEYVVGFLPAEQKPLVVSVFVESSATQNIIVEFVDFFTNEVGERTQLPPGSTPYSLAKALEVQPFDGFYKGGSGQQQFEIEITPISSSLESIYSGAILVRLEPQAGASNGIGAKGSVLNSIMVTPFGIAASLAEGQLKAAEIVGHELKRLSRSSFIDSILPDIPGVVNYGPVESKVVYKNFGEYPVFTSARWEFSSGKETLASKSFRSSLLAPGQTDFKSVTTQIPGGSDELLLNVLPNFGFVSNQISLLSSLGGQDLPVATRDGSFLVVQWKEPFVALLGLYFLVRWAWRRNLSQRKKEESASLVWLAIRDLFRKSSKSKSSGLGLTRVSANPEVQLQAFAPPEGSPNKYDIKPVRLSLVDPRQQSRRSQEPPLSRF